MPIAIVTQSRKHVRLIARLHEKKRFPVLRPTDANRIHRFVAVNAAKDPRQGFARLLIRNCSFCPWLVAKMPRWRLSWLEQPPSTGGEFFFFFFNPACLCRAERLAFERGAGAPFSRNGDNFCRVRATSRFSSRSSLFRRLAFADGRCRSAQRVVRGNDDRSEGNRRFSRVRARFATTGRMKRSWIKGDAL